ncbi:MAG: RNA-guided pseudouridylation complex pseudouridine synthase subunit Cbf5 [Archaeoglobaceae archaeon]
MKLGDYYIIEEFQTSEKYGCPPNKRSVEEHIKKGFVCVDKPKGPSSHEVVVWVRNILQVKKTGHAGTLDPKVTGVLPVFIETATKLVKFLQESSKEYVCLMRLHGDVKEEEIKKVFKMFTGKIFQKPPLKSAVKKELRIREIYNIQILEIDGRDILFKISAESGTYIRKLCKDIGEVLGVGAHMQELRRIRTGNFLETDSYTLQDLLDAYVFWKEEGDEKYIREIIKPMELAVANVPKIVIKDTAVDAICHGANLSIKGVSMVEKNVKRDSTVAIFTAKGELVALGKALVNAEDMLELKRGIVVDVERVLMERGVYPSIWKSK